MKQVLVKHGGVTVEEVPAPVVGVGEVLVRVHHSCISPGTELSGVRMSKRALWQQALQRPKEVRRLVDRVRSDGIVETRRLVRARLEEAHPLGYSASGVVVAVGEGVSDLAVGDRVACGGSQGAHHAEFIAVARNLTAIVPAEVASEHACTVALCAIALQGVRRGEPTLGETFVVVGLGIIGQLTQQLLRVNGVRVIGVELERRRIDMARGLGIDVAVHPDDGDIPEQVRRLTEGYGADAVIVTAASASNDVIAMAFRCCRRKGRVVLVGDVGLEIDRADIYGKELDFLVSTSYGPGRYDRSYEEGGCDYPLAYVRWTENRNMQECLRLMADGRLRLAPLVERIYPVDQASAAYRALESEGTRPLVVVLSYPQDERPPVRRVANPRAAGARQGAIRFAVLGAGGFARGTLLPIIADMREEFSLVAVVAKRGYSAANTAREFKAGVSSTDYRSVLADDSVDAVMIATRHDLHGPLVVDALRAGKHVLVEKPLCLGREELDEIAAFFQSGVDRAPILMVGFNRRFSVYMQALMRVSAERNAPLIANYRVNAGFLPADHWVHGAEGGGRNLGEACHFYDLLTFLTGARIAGVQATSIRPESGHYRRNDNFIATLSFVDGSIATLTYTALGAPGHPKERVDVYVDGKVLSVDDYRRFDVVGAPGIKSFRTRRAEKGHREELMAFARSIRKGGEWPIPLWQLVQATEIALEVEQQINTGDVR